MANASPNPPPTSGTTGLSWAQITKRPNDVLDEIFARMDGDHPFVLMAKHTDSDDGVYIYFRQLVVMTPRYDKVKKSWDKKDYTAVRFQVKKIASVSNLKSYIKQQTGLDWDNLNTPIDPANPNSTWAKAPVKIQFSSGQGLGSRTINSGWILKDGTIYGNSSQGLGGKPPKGTVRGVKWGKLALLSEPPLNIPITLNYPTSTEQGESAFISDFNSQVEQVAGANGGRGLDMDIGGTVFENVIGVNKVAGTGKADLVFIALQDRKLVEVCWASHKKGSQAKDFGQWGGMTELYNTDATVKEFVDYCKKIVGVGKFFDFTKFSKGATIGMKIGGSQYANLRKYAVYGPRHTGTFGPEKCNVVLQGDPTITYGTSHSTLSMSGHLVNYPTEMTGPYEPVLMCIKKASTENILAGKGRADFGVQGARFSIFPYGENTRVTHWVIKDSKGNLKLDRDVYS